MSDTVDVTAMWRYATLLDEVPELAYLLRHSPGAAAPLIAALNGVRERAALELMAADPNSPPAALAFLAGVFPAALCVNPVFPLLLLENPNLPAEMELAALGGLLAYAGVPADFLAAVAAYGPPEMAQAARLHVALAGLAGEDWRDEVGTELMRLVNLPDDDLMMALAALGLLPEWLRERVAAGNQRAAAALAGELPALESQTSPPARPSPIPAADDPATPLEELLRLFDDENPLVRAAVARNPAVPAELLLELKRREDAMDVDLAVYEALAANPCTPPELLIELAANQAALFTRTRRLVAVHPAAPAEALALLADDLYAGEIRLILAGHPKLAPEQRAAMAETALVAALGAGDPIYRAIALAHPSTEPEILAGAGTSPFWVERLALALNPATPAKTLARLADDGNRLVRAAVLRRYCP